MSSSDKGHLTYFEKCVLDVDGTVKYIPSRFCSILGYSEQEIVGLHITKLTHPDDQKEMSDYLEKIKEGRISEFKSQLRFVTKSGEAISVFLSGIQNRDQSGDPVSIICHLQNLSQQEKIYRELEMKEQQFESLFKHNPHPVYYFDTEGNFQGVNDKLIEFTRYSRDELLKMNFEQFIVEEDLERTKRHFQNALNGEAGQYEIKVIINDGTIKDIRVTKFPKIVGDEVTGVFGILQDITDEKIAKEKLEKSEHRWHKLVEQNPQPVQIVQDGKIAFINQVGAEYYGATLPDELVGKSIMDFTHPDNMENALKRKKALEDEQQVDSDEHKIVLINGEERYIEAHSIPIKYKGKNAIQTVIHDISDLKNQQQIVNKSLKEKETLLQEIHHRVKNNLAMISSLLELQILQSTEEAATNALRDSQLRIQSMAMIHEKLYQNESLNDIGFDEYLVDLVQTIKNTYRYSGKNIETTFTLDHVFLDINQVIPCSLIVNEVIVNCFKHAFEDNGQSEIEISLAHENSTLKLKIVDNGKGLPKDFDISEQQSLGMTLIKTLSEQLHGQLNLASGPRGKGTVFQLIFNKNPSRF